MFSPIIWFFFLVWSRRYIIYRMGFLPLLDTPYGKRNIYRIKLVNSLQCIQEEGLHSRKSFRTTDKSLRLILQPEKRLTNPTNTTPPTWKTYGLSRHRCCSILNFGDVNHSHSDRCQPLTTVKHERRNVGLWVGGCRMPKYRHSLSLLRDLLGDKKSLGSVQVFFDDGLQRNHEFISRDTLFP